MPDVLVTGASGSIGTAICQHLMAAGWQVTAQGRSRPPDSTGHRSVATGAFDDQLDWSAAVKGADAIVHGAALTWVDADDEAEALAEFHRVNVAATSALIRDAARAGVRRIVYISSMTVHGPYAGRPFRPDDPLRPDSPYARSKAEAEALLHEEGATVGIEIVVLRLPLVVGPEYSGNMARLAALVARGVPLPFGAIRHNRRCRLSRDNLLQAIRLALEVPQAAGETFLISDGTPCSTRAMVEEIGARVGRKPRFLPVPPWSLRALVRLLPQFLLGKLSREAMAAELLGDYEIDISHTRDVLGYVPR